MSKWMLPVLILNGLISRQQTRSAVIIALPGLISAAIQSAVAIFQATAKSPTPPPTTSATVFKLYSPWSSLLTTKQEHILQGRKIKCLRALLYPAKTRKYRRRRRGRRKRRRKAEVSRCQNPTTIETTHRSRLPELQSAGFSCLSGNVMLP